MFDQESLQPVIKALALYSAKASLLAQCVKKPTGVQVVDDLVMTIIAQKGSLMSGTVLIGLIVLATNYIQDKLL